MVTTNAQSMGRYLRALEAELELIDLVPGAALETLYLGGGTPSLLPGLDFQRLVRSITRRFPLVTGAEVTAEANPEDVTPERLDAWIEAGVTRISMGVQSFDDGELRALDRRHDSRTACRAAALVRERSELELNLDLMLGIPGQDRTSLQASLSVLLDLAPAHVSVYLLEMDKPHRLRALKRRHPERFAGEEDSAGMYLEVHETLTGRGFEHYEVSNFARGGSRARHNLRYWHCRPVHAVGVAAHGAEGRRRWANLENIPAYIEAVNERIRPLAWATVLSPRECLAEELLMGLRLEDGVSPARIAEGRSLFPDFSRRLDEFLDLGLAVEKTGRCRLEPRGWLVSNELFVTLV